MPKIYELQEKRILNWEKTPPSPQLEDDAEVAGAEEVALQIRDRRA